MEECDETPLDLNGYKVHLTSVGRGKGIATYYKADMFKHEEDFKDKNMQITKYTSTCGNLEIINVYRSSKSKPPQPNNEDVDK